MLCFLQVLSCYSYKSVAKQLADIFDFEKIAIPLCSSISVNDNDWAVMLYDGGDYHFLKEYTYILLIVSAGQIVSAEDGFMRSFPENLADGDGSCRDKINDCLIF